MVRRIGIAEVIKGGAAIAIVLLSGCVSSTGVVPIGQDSYMLSVSDNSRPGITGAEVKANAYRQAAAYCESIGKRLQPVNALQRDQKFGVIANAEIQFLCLAPGDADLTRAKRRLDRPDSDSTISIHKDVSVRNESATSKDTYSELLKLDDLRKRGVITDAEFDDQKRRLLYPK